jgi:hypothetical protein
MARRINRAPKWSNLTIHPCLPPLSCYLVKRETGRYKGQSSFLLQKEAQRYGNRIDRSVGGVLTRWRGLGIPSLAWLKLETAASRDIYQLTRARGRLLGQSFVVGRSMRARANSLLDVLTRSYQAKRILTSDARASPPPLSGTMINSRTPTSNRSTA